ncbi:MAG: glycosyltransferase [bacterium]|nr:glycosyltransferase [bacterium]
MPIKVTNGKRIAMFVHDDPLAPVGSQETGGQAVYVHHLIKELNKKGYFIDIFLRSDSLHKKPISQFGKRSRVIRLKGGPQKYVPRKQLFNFLPEIYKSFLEFIGPESNYDLFHGHYWDGGWLAMMAAAQFKKPFVENFHSLGKVREQTREKYSFTSAVKDIFDRRFSIEKDIIKSASAIISLAESEKEGLKTYYNAEAQKVHVIAGGVDHNIFFPIEKKEARKEINFRDEDVILLFVGRLEWRKGVGTLLYAAELAKKEIPNLKVIIIGGKIHGRQKNIDDFNEYQRLWEIVKEKKLEKNIHFAGSIDHNRLPLFYSAADIFIIPSYYEPFGLVILESMACKTPVIGSRVDGITATIQDNVTGLLFNPRDAKDLSEKILLMQKNGDLRKTMAENAYQKIMANYSWKSITQKIIDEYSKLIP